MCCKWCLPVLLPTCSVGLLVEGLSASHGQGVAAFSYQLICAPACSVFLLCQGVSCWIPVSNIRTDDVCRCYFGGEFICDISPLGRYCKMAALFWSSITSIACHSPPIVHSYFRVSLAVRGGKEAYRSELFPGCTALIPASRRMVMVRAVLSRISLRME